MKYAKASHKLISIPVRLTHTYPLTSNDGASYQINGKIATSKGGGKTHLKPFKQVDYFQLLAHSQDKYPFYF